MTKDNDKKLVGITYYIKGRVHIPKHIAKSCELKEGDTLLIKLSSDSIVLKKVEKEKLIKAIG